MSILNGQPIKGKEHVYQSQRCGGYIDCYNSLEEEHSCPYQDELFGNSVNVCTCCDACAAECARAT